jgi:predicted nucleotidyltransferase
MARLEDLGILTSKREGNLRQYQANRECPFYDELKGLVLKTVGVAGEIKTALDQLAGIESAFLYGSYARRDEKATSDVDLVIVGDVDMDKLDVLMGKLEKRLGREINYVLYSKREFKAKIKKSDGFVMDVLAGEKIMLTGKEDGLSRA